MRRNRASSTAKVVAMWRALADTGATTVPGFRDPFAAELLSGGFRLMLAQSQRRLQRLPAAGRALTIQRFDPIPIRVAVIDAELLAAVKRGCRQVVMLGAGLDTRAWRFDELAGTTVYEVDHPATQELKRHRATMLPAPKARIVWTPVDFERDSLTARLASAGHDASAPTVWIWEGVVMYLPDVAVTSTLNAVRSRSAAGTVLLLHYHEPSGTSLARTVRGFVFSWIGEPQVGLRRSAEMRGLVERAGFQVQADLGIAEQAARVGAVAPENDLARVSRILVAAPT
jgi:methyltransferase (TIGR00027 family)